MRARRATKDELAEFRRDVAAGRGRALLLVRRTKGRGLEREIDRACLRSRGFDSQVDGSRGAWLHELAQLGGRTRELTPRLVRALARSVKAPRPWDWVQQFEWLAQEALDGNAAARAALLRAYRDASGEHRSHVTEVYLRATGVEGWNEIAPALARADAVEQAGLLFEALEGLGTRRFQRVGGFDLLSAQRGGPRPVRPRLAAPRKWTWREVEAALTSPRSDLSWRTWARSAPQRQLERLDARLSTESSRLVQLHILRVFSVQPLQTSLERARQLARGRDPQLAFAAATALVRTDDPESLELAREWLASTTPLRDTRWLQLLAARGSGRDARALARRLPELPNVHLAHDLGNAILEWAERERAPELRPLLRWAWDHDPCGYCREKALKALGRGSRVPRPVLREALADAAPAVRELARRLARRSR